MILTEEKKTVGPRARVDPAMTSTSRLDTPSPLPALPISFSFEVALPDPPVVPALDRRQKDEPMQRVLIRYDFATRWR